MQNLEINIEQLSGKNTVSREDGKVVHDRITKLWNEYVKISVDFKNLLIASVSFIDEAFGHLALEHSIEELKSKMEFLNMSEYDRALLNDIIHARLRQRTLERRKKRS